MLQLLPNDRRRGGAPVREWRDLGRGGEPHAGEVNPGGGGMVGFGCLL